MLSSMVAFLWPDMLQGETFADAGAHSEAAERRSALLVRAGNGKWLVCTATTDAQWAALCKTVEQPEWSSEFPSRAYMLKHKKEIAERLTRLWSGKGRDDVLTALRQADVPCGPVNTLEEMLADPQVAASESWMLATRPGLGRVREPGPMVRLGNQERPAGSLPAPRLGEHTQAVVSELVDGFDASRDAEAHAGGTGGLEA